LNLSIAMAAFVVVTGGVSDCQNSLGRKR